MTGNQKLFAICWLATMAAVAAANMGCVASCHAPVVSLAKGDER